MKKKLAVVAAGGPAPGINSVIGAATIRACLSGVEVVGLQDGFKWLMQGDTSKVVPLTIAETSRIHFRGGSHIGISRANPTKTPEALQNTLEAFERLGVSMLVTIGGDGTAALAHLLAQKWMGRMRVVHVPKTIDNDLDLPHETSTFGFQTARHVGVEIVKNLMVDARTTSRWYYVVAQGRKAGHLALAIGKAVGATITLVPEEFPRNTPLAQVVDTLAGSVIKRMADGRPDGVAMLAEGLADRIDPEDLGRHTNLPRDAMGNIHVAEVNLGEVLKKAVDARLAELKVKSRTIISKSIGYEVRCADPIPFDMEYTRDLGYCAARYVIEGGTDAVITLIDGRFQPIPFAAMIDPATGNPRVRMVDIESDRYKIARSYMLRLRREDFESPSTLAKIAAQTCLTPAEFRETFFGVVTDEPLPMVMG